MLLSAATEREKISIGEFDSDAATLTSDSLTLTSCSCLEHFGHTTASAAQMPLTGARNTPSGCSLDDSSTCLELALEGERLCKGGECRLGVQFLEAAVLVGTDDLKILSAVYSQLGNAHFYLQDYDKALNFHTLDLSLARKMRDKAGEAKASGNLGNTLKVLGKFEEASMCCMRHLQLARELGDKMGEARALYNLGNVHHAQGKHTGRVSHLSSFSQSADGGELVAGAAGYSPVRECLRRAAEFYEQNLAIVRDLGDRAGVGRACGNLGNTHYLLGNFHEAIRYHTERLAVAREFGDRGAERRAHSNLGNAHILLGELDTAADHYRRCLTLARQLGEPALEAQACYSLGNTCTLMRDFRQAIDYHSRHMRIAEQLGDRVGEARACWSLGNAHAAVGDNARALEFARRHLELSEQLGDEVGAAAARLNLADLRHLLGLSPESAEEEEAGGQRGRHSTGNLDSGDEGDGLKARDVNELEGLNLPRRASEGSGLDAAAADDLEGGGGGGELEAFWDLVSRYQSRRMDEQRCQVPALAGVAPVPPVAAAAAAAGSQHQQRQGQMQMEDAFLDMLAGVQGSRMNDQRATLPPCEAGNNGDHINGGLPALRAQQRNKENLLPDDAFFDMLMRCQATRLDEQRTALPTSSAAAAAAATAEVPSSNPAVAAPTVPEDDVFAASQKQQLIQSTGSKLFSKLSLKKRRR